jgi:hypothetical protein
LELPMTAERELAIPRCVAAVAFAGFRTPALYRVHRSRRAGIRNPTREPTFTGPAPNRCSRPKLTFAPTVLREPSSVKRCTKGCRDLWTYGQLPRVKGLTLMVNSLFDG